MDMDFSMFANMAAERHSEDNVCARFYDRSVKTGQIDQHGFPVFANVCFCEIRIKDNTPRFLISPPTPIKSGVSRVNTRAIDRPSNNSPKARP